MDSLKRWFIPAAAAIVAAAAAWPQRFLLAANGHGVDVLGIYDGSQKRWGITRNYPVAGRLRTRRPRGA